MGRSYSDRDLKLLWGLSAGRCAFPDCKLVCMVDATDIDPVAIVGHIGHIRGWSDEGPRADSTLSPKERNSYDNLILLCSIHHTLVDVQDSTYTIECLEIWKEGHEHWVRECLATEMPEVTFAELEVVSQGILNSSLPPSTDFNVLAPEEKMEQNNLTNQVRFLLTMGIGKANEVKEFIEHVAIVDATFPERLRSRFVQEYENFKDRGYYGDSLFEALRQFACDSNEDFKRQAAGLATLAYLFQACEIFES